MLTLIWQVAWPRSTVPIWPESTYACAARFRTHKTFAFNGLHVPHVFLLLFFIAGLFSLSAAGDGRRFMIWLQFRYKSKVSSAYIIRPRWGHWIRSNQAPGESIIVIKAKQSRPSTIINYQLAWHGQLFWWHFNAIIWFSLKFSIHTHKFHLHHIYLLVNWTHRYIVLVLHYITH